MDSPRRICPVRSCGAVLLSMAAAFGLVLWDVCAAREKTDRVRVANGDTVHGEIRQLRYGYLSLSTDSFGTVNVEWPDVRSLSSDYAFVVELTDGQRHYGQLRAPDQEGRLIIAPGSGAQVQVRLERVAQIVAVEDRFWDQVDGSFSIGFNAAKSTDVQVGSARVTTQYRSRTMLASLNASVETSNSGEGKSNSRVLVSYNQRQVRPGPAFGFGIASFERNDQLGLDGRLQLGGGVGRYLKQTPISNLTVLAGLTVNQENNSGEGETQQTIEGVLGAEWRIFRFADPETTLTSSLQLFPSLTESDRYRSSLDVSLRREFISDFFLDLSFYGSYDSDPPDQDAATSDYGITTSLGYSF